METKIAGNDKFGYILNSFWLINPSYSFPISSISSAAKLWYSIYTPKYVEPAVKTDQFEDGKLPFDVSTPVKAAPLWSTSSFTHDPLLL